MQEQARSALASTLATIEGLEVEAIERKGEGGAVGLEGGVKGQKKAHTAIAHESATQGMASQQKVPEQGHIRTAVPKDSLPVAPFSDEVALSACSPPPPASHISSAPLPTASPPASATGASSLVGAEEAPSPPAPSIAYAESVAEPDAKPDAKPKAESDAESPKKAEVASAKTFRVATITSALASPRSLLKHTVRLGIVSAPRASKPPLKV